jgi:hypothetical protein
LQSGVDLSTVRLEFIGNSAGLGFADFNIAAQGMAIDSATKRHRNAET